MTLTVGSLFAGIGGFDLGLERTGGFRTSWFCEQDKFCQRVLAKHWPGVPCYEDVCALTGASVSPVDVLCGGFPCQDISLAGKGAGIGGSRSGLWSEYARLIGEIEPRWVVVENVAALLGRGLSVVLADLSALGYDAEWDCLPASAFGAPHRRDRIWLVAYPARNAASGVRASAGSERKRVGTGGQPGGTPEVADSANQRHKRSRHARDGRTRSSDGCYRSAPEQWEFEPNVGRVANGIPSRVDRLRSLGNALVPQIPEWIGYRILAYEAERGRP